MAVAAGCKGPHAIAQFAHSLNHAQRRCLRCRPRLGKPGQYRDHWSIENGLHYRRDRTQDEDRCPMRDPTAARNLSLFRSLAIFLFKAQSRAKGAKQSLPDFERHVHRKPWRLIHRITQRRHEE